MIQHFDENLVGIDYIVGDIHGCFTLLETKLLELGFNEETDRLFSTGDLVDRGLESIRALEFLDKPWFHPIRGNHEDMAIMYNDRTPKDWYSANGGDWFMLLDSDTQLVIKERFLKLPLAIDIKINNKLVGIIHADCPVAWTSLPSYLEDDYSIEAVMWSRTKYKYQDTSIIEGVNLLYVGHTIVKEVAMLGNVRYIDTGVIAYNNLTIEIIKDTY